MNLSVDSQKWTLFFNLDLTNLQEATFPYNIDNLFTMFAFSPLGVTVFLVKFPLNVILNLCKSYS